MVHLQGQKEGNDYIREGKKTINVKNLGDSHYNKMNAESIILQIISSMAA